MNLIHSLSFSDTHPAAFGVLGAHPVEWSEDNGDGAISADIKLSEGASSVDLAFPCLSSDQHSKNGLIFSYFHLSGNIEKIHSKHFGSHSPDLSTV